jgi:hypothetical protein
LQKGSNPHHVEVVRDGILLPHQVLHHFAQGIGRDGTKFVAFPDRVVVRRDVPIFVTTAHHDDPSSRRRTTHGLQHVVLHQGIGGDGAHRILQRDRRRTLRCQVMHHGRHDLAHDIQHRQPVVQIHRMKHDLIGQPGPIVGRVTVDPMNRMAGRGVLLDQRAPGETGGAGDENRHHGDHAIGGCMGGIEWSIMDHFFRAVNALMLVRVQQVSNCSDG